MKTNLIYLILMVAAISFNACKKDEVQVPKLIPTVVTGGAVSITLSSATVAGTISSDGNSPVTKTGIVYSSNVSLPTIVDNKKELTDVDGDFSAVLDALTSGTTYHARAYAINAVGTGYGAVVDFTTGNAAPVVTNVSITGALEVNKALTAAYTYGDAENNSEGATTFQWYVAASSTGTGETAIAGATSKTFLVLDAQNGKFLRVSVTPKATSGTVEGTEVKSSYTGEVGSETVTFNYNGASVTYGTIISGTTQKKWLDRNLGASHVATSITDFQAFGDLHQWGRLSDGHQLILRDASGGSGVTGTSSTTSSNNVPVTNKFIINTALAGDWRIPQEDNLWQGVNGVNNPCPAGWRIPTKAEWLAEGFTSGNDAFAKLKLTINGSRDQSNGNLIYPEYGFYWTSTIDTSDPTIKFSTYFYLDATTFDNYYTNRGVGNGCRCIKE